VHRKADEGGIPGRMSTEENAARCVPGRREASRDFPSRALAGTYGVHRLTVTSLLRRLSVDLCQVGLSEDQVVRLLASIVRGQTGWFRVARVVAR
jgi:hypothetical protein